MEAKSVHANRSARPSNVIDERPGVCAGDLRDPLERTGENADTFVARQHDPAVPACFGEPDLVRRALGEMVGEPLNARPRVAQGAYDRKTVERLIDKERDRFKRLRGRLRSGSRPRSLLR